MKKRLFKPLFLFSLLFSGVLLASTPIQAQITNVKVGLLTPMTGGLSAYTTGFEQAAQLAIDHLNTDPSINSEYSFSLTKYDTQTAPAVSAQAMTQAVADGMHYVVGAAGSSNTLAAAAVGVANKIPLISYASTAPDLTTFDDHAVLGDEGYLWRIPPAYTLQGEVLADLAYDGKNTKMVIIAMDNSYGTSLASSTKTEFEALGGSATVFTYSESTVNASAVISQIVSENPDIVVAISYNSDGSLLFVELLNQNLGLPVIGADGIVNEAIFSVTNGTQEAMQGFLGVKEISADTPRSQAFNEAYINTYGDMMGDIYTAETYDAVWAGALAILSQGSLTGDDIIIGLASTTWEGATGLMSFDENGDSNTGFFQISEVRADTWVRVGTWDRINALIYENTAFYNRWTSNYVDVKVGLLTPMTGALSALSQEFEQGGQLAIDHLNDDPNVNSTYTFSLSKYDTQTDPTGATIAMTQAVTDGMHYVAGAAGSSNTLAAAEVAVSNEIPLISYASTSPELTTFDDHAVIGDAGYLWRIPASDAKEGEAIADLAYDGGNRKMMIVGVDHYWGELMANSITDNFESRGGIVDGVIFYSPSMTDFSEIVYQINLENPDIIIAISYQTDGALLFVEMEKQNLGIPVIGADTVASEMIFDENTEAQDAMQGFLTVNFISVISPDSQAFIVAYTDKFELPKFNNIAAQTYDAIRAGALAIALEESIIGNDIINGLANITFEGASGPISFDENGDSRAGQFQISEVQLDSMERVGTWDTVNGLIYEDAAFYNRWILPPISRIPTSASITSEITSSTSNQSPTSNDDTTSETGLRLPFPIYGLVLSFVILSNIIRFKRRK